MKILPVYKYIQDHKWLVPFSFIVCFTFYVVAFVLMFPIHQNLYQISKFPQNLNLMDNDVVIEESKVYSASKTLFDTSTALGLNFYSNTGAKKESLRYQNSTNGTQLLSTLIDKTGTTITKINAKSTNLTTRSSTEYSTKSTSIHLMDETHTTKSGLQKMLTNKTTLSSTKYFIKTTSVRLENISVTNLRSDSMISYVTTNKGEIYTEPKETLAEIARNESSKFWKVEKIAVKVIPKDRVKSFTKHSIFVSKNDDEIIEMIDLSLTPPIVTVWGYQLAFALSQGWLMFNYV